MYRRVYILVGMLLAAFLGVAAAQATPPSADADARAIAAYRFSEATLAKFIAASRQMAAAAQPGRDSMDEDDGDEDNQTIDDIAAFYDRTPPLRRAIAGAG